MNNIDKIANTASTKDHNIIDEEDIDEFEKMLNDFIAQEIEDTVEDAQMELEEIEKKAKTEKNKPISDTNETVSDSAENTEEDEIQLGEHEYSLFRAYKNFMYAINMLAEEFELPPVPLHLSEKKIYPHYKKPAGTAVSKDVLIGWDIMLKTFSEDMSAINPNSSDDQLLDFAERCEYENLQLAVISYVETMIELEGCEIDYERRKLKYQRRKLEKEIYDEHQRRVNRTKQYIKAIKEKNFPIDAERLVNNYFRLSNKDPEGSFNVLVTNPATFAPIDFNKIKDRFFGMIKVKPQDGIRINQKIGTFLKKLKA